MLHDSHFHLDLMSSPDTMVNEIEASKTYTIAVTNSPTVFLHTEKLTEGMKYIRPGLGLHPELAAERHHEVDKFLRLINRTRYIGEIGLDNMRKSKADYEKQKIVFSKIISGCAEKGGKVLTIHSRRAAQDITDIIGEGFPGKVIYHWYSGSLSMMDKALKRGAYFSVNYPMLFSESGRKIIARIPLERLLIESDGPFTHFNGRPFTPLYVNKIASELQKIENSQNQKVDIKTQLRRNFATLIKL